MNRRFLLTTAGAALAVGSSWTAAFAQEAADTTATPETDAPAPRVYDMVLGAEDAKVTMVEYGSFTCPHCAAFHKEVFLPLKRDYIDTGKVRFVYRELARNRFDIWASMLARCGGDIRYFGITEMIFTQQADWAGASDPAAVAGKLRTMGKVAGFDDATMDVCLGDAELAQEILTFSQTNAEADSIEGTPTVIIDGEKVTNRSWEEFKQLIDAKLGE